MDVILFYVTQVSYIQIANSINRESTNEKKRNYDEEHGTFMGNYSELQTHNVLYQINDTIIPLEMTFILTYG